MPNKTSVQGLRRGVIYKQQYLYRKEKSTIIDPSKTDHHFPFILLCQPGGVGSTLCEGMQSIFPVKGRRIHVKTYHKGSRLNSCKLGRKSTKKLLHETECVLPCKILPTPTGSKGNRKNGPCPQRTPNLSKENGT